MTAEAAVIKDKRGVSAVWIVPVLALAFGFLVLIDSWRKQGPEVQIRFATAQGLEAGKTKIKFRSVDMGVVESVQLSDDYNGVVAVAQLTPQAVPLLREDTNFWVVTARVGVGNVTGLDTLLSGAYIQLEPGVSEVERRDFQALEKPPQTSADAEGISLQLTSDASIPVSVGDRVFYRGYEVGRIESKAFDLERGGVDYTVFIDAPFDSLVNSAVRFWDSGGVSIVADAEGVRLDAAPLDSVLLGGISFGIPEGAVAGDPVEPGTTFRLFASYDEILKNPFRFGSQYVLEFAGSVNGLYPGAPVEYRGIPVGRVERVLLKESLELAVDTGAAGSGSPILVLIYVEPARLEMPDRRSSVDQMREVLDASVGRGLRASLETGNLLTGAKYVALEYRADAEPAEVGQFRQWRTIPTINTGLEQLQEKVSRVLDQLAALPLQNTVLKVDSLLDELKSVVASAGELLDSQGAQALPQELAGALEELRKTINSVGPDSDFSRRLNESLLRLNSSLENLDDLTSTLARKPSSAIVPSAVTPDPVPKAPQ